MTTLVQIKRSSSNATPSSLLEGELAYSFVSDKIFIGNTSSDVLTIGGQYYTDIIDSANSANSSSTLVQRYANGSAQFSQLDILLPPTENSHVATKEYVDNASGNVFLNSINDVSVVGDPLDQNNKILLGQANGFYVTTSISGNVAISNTGVVTIGAGQVINSMLQNNSVTINGGAGLSNGGSVSLGDSLTIDVIAGDGISNSNGDSVSVDTTVVRTDRNQTLNGFMTFSNTTTFSSNVEISGDLLVSGALNVQSLTLNTALSVSSGGTGVDSFTANGVFYSSNASTLAFATGTEGEVLQIASGIPSFAMLEGGNF